MIREVISMAKLINDVPNHTPLISLLLNLVLLIILFGHGESFTRSETVNLDWKVSRHISLSLSLSVPFENLYH